MKTSQGTRRMSAGRTRLISGSFAYALVRRTIQYAYDTIGNHVFLAYNSATNFYANNQLNQTTASYACVPTTGSGNNDTPLLFAGYDILTTNRLTWSAQGGLQRDGRFIYAFDAEDQLVSVTSAALTNGAIRVVNAYDYRFYSSALKFWLNRDLIEESGGDNLYVLSHNHPNISFDYLGCFEMHIHAEGVGHVGLRDKEGLTYDYGRYKGRYSQSRNPLYYSGPNILITGKDQSGHSYSVYKFDVCPLVDEKVSQVLKKKFDSGMKILPEEIIMRYDKKPDVLKVNERYMGSDWSPNNNCMTFSFSVLATAAREVLSDSHSSKSERDQARAMLALAFLSCWRYSPLDAKLMMDELASKSKFISKQ